MAYPFNHVETDLPDLKTKTIDRKRYYITPDDKEYPSITTVLSNRGKEGLRHLHQKEMINTTRTIIYKHQHTLRCMGREQAHR